MANVTSHQVLPFLYEGDFLDGGEKSIFRCAKVDDGNGEVERLAVRISCDGDAKNSRVF